MGETWTPLKVLDWTAGRFQRAGVESARLDAQVLLAHTLGCDRVGLYTNFDKPLGAEELGSYRKLIQRRLDGEPVAYLIGCQEFWSLSFEVDRRVLIPRADTETLVQVGLELMDERGLRDSDCKVLEIATGSGAVAISLAHERPSWQLTATDLSDDALTVARRNASNNKVAERIDFRLGCLLEPLHDSETFALLVANLPYISRSDMANLPASVKHEPEGALFGGEDGLDLITKLVEGAKTVVDQGGWIALEHGYDQGPQVRGLAEKFGYHDVATRDDLAGRARVTFFRN